VYTNVSVHNWVGNDENRISECILLDWLLSTASNDGVLTRYPLLRGVDRLEELIPSFIEQGMKDISSKVKCYSSHTLLDNSQISWNVSRAEFDQQVGFEGEKIISPKAHRSSGTGMVKTTVSVLESLSFPESLFQFILLPVKA